MKKVFPLIAGLSAPLLPLWALAYGIRYEGVDHVSYVAYAVFGLGGLLGGSVAGYLADSDAALYGAAVGALACALILIGTFVNAMVSPASVLYVNADSLLWTCAVTLGMAILGSKFGEQRARHEESAEEKVESAEENAKSAEC